MVPALSESGLVDFTKNAFDKCGVVDWTSLSVFVLPSEVNSSANPDKIHYQQ